jgi:hypothetical protein
MWLGLAAAAWTGFEGYRHFARIQEQLGMLWVHPRMGGANWSAVYYHWGVMMGCLALASAGGLLCRFGERLPIK